MAAHRYWRLLIPKTGGHSYVTIAVLVLAQSPSGAQAAVGGTASASTQTASAGNAFDGNSATNWTSSAGYSNSVGREHIQYDMGAGNAIDVAEVRLTFPTGVTALAYPGSFSLFHSDNGLDWTLQRGWSEQVFASGETKTLDATPLLANQVFNRVIIDRTIRYSLAAHAGPPTLRRVLDKPIPLIRGGSAAATVTPWSGEYYIAGSTTVLGQPFARRVDLVEQKTGLLVRTIHTKEDGAFLFEGIGPGPWTVIGVDSSAEQNSVIYAHVTPSPMI